MIKSYSQCTMQINKFSQRSSIIWPIRLNGWVFVYEISGCKFEFHCSQSPFYTRRSEYRALYGVRLDILTGIMQPSTNQLLKKCQVKINNSIHLQWQAHSSHLQWKAPLDNGQKIKDRENLVQISYKKPPDSG